MADPTPLAWPTDLGFGTLTGRFVYLDGDSDDAGDEPDLIPAAGGTVTVKANAPLAAYLGSSPMTAVAREVVGIIDAQGYLCRRTASGLPGARGLPLIATDSKKLSTEGFNYAVTVKLPGATIPTMNLSVPAGQAIDITTAVSQSVSAGTKVVALTPEIRAEIAKAVESVQIDTAGLVTPEALSSALSTKANSATVTAGLAERPTRAEAEQIALDNALLNEDQPVRSAAIVDGALVLTRRDGVELTVSGSVAPSAGGVSITRRLGWQDVSMPCDWAWVHREGAHVRLVLVNPKIANNTAIWTPPVGWRVGAVGDSDALLGATVTEYDGTSRSTQRNAHMFETTIYSDAKKGSETPETPVQVERMIVEWLTWDAPDTTGTLGVALDA